MMDWHLSRSTRLIAACALPALAMLAGCSDPNAAIKENAASQALSENKLPPTPEMLAQDVLTAQIAAGGIPASYEAAFEDGQLRRIVEQRGAEGAAEREGQYVFYGARLIEFSGAALQSDNSIELTFDTQGTLTSSGGIHGTPDEAEVSAIRNRAQLLRSHALARRSVHAHGG